jgi:hypothetical protein
MGYEWRYTYSVQLQLKDFMDTAYIFSRKYFTPMVSSQNLRSSHLISLRFAVTILKIKFWSLETFCGAIKRDTNRDSHNNFAFQQKEISVIVYWT